MGVTTDWSGSGNGGPGGDWGIYLPPPEDIRSIHFELSYHVILFGVRTESGNAPIQAMVGAACPGYNGDKGGAGSHVGRGGDGGG